MGYFADRMRDFALQLGGLLTCALLSMGPCKIALSAESGIFRGTFDGPCADCLISVGVSVPSNFAASGYFSSATDQTATSNLPVLRDIPSIVGAIPFDSTKMPLLGVTRGTYAIYGGETTSVVLSYQSTAEAMVFLFPGIYGSDSIAASTAWQYVSANNQVQQLGVWLSDHPNDAALDTPEFAILLAAAVDGVAAQMMADRSRHDRHLSELGGTSARPWRLYGFPGEFTSVNVEPDSNTLTASLSTLLGSSLYRATSIEVVRAPDDALFFDIDGNFSEPALIFPTTVGHATAPVLGEAVLDGRGIVSTIFGLDAVVATLVDNFVGSEFRVDLGTVENDVVQVRAFTGAIESPAQSDFIDASPTWRAKATTARAANLVAASLDMFSAIVSLAVVTDPTLELCVTQEAIAIFNQLALTAAIHGIEDTTQTVVQLAAGLAGGVAECAGPQFTRAIVLRFFRRLIPALGEVKVVYQLISSGVQLSALSERIENLIEDSPIETVYIARAQGTSIVDATARYVQSASANSGEINADAYFYFEFTPAFMNGSLVNVKCTDPACIYPSSTNYLITEVDPAFGMAFMGDAYRTSDLITEVCYDAEFFYGPEFLLEMPVPPALDRLCYPLFNPGILQAAFGSEVPWRIEQRVGFVDFYNSNVNEMQLSTQAWGLAGITFIGPRIVAFGVPSTIDPSYTYHEGGYSVCGLSETQYDLTDYTYEITGPLFRASGTLKLTRLEDYDFENACYRSDDHFEFPFSFVGFSESEIEARALGASVSRVTNAQ